VLVGVSVCEIFVSLSYCEQYLTTSIT